MYMIHIAIRLSLLGAALALATAPLQAMQRAAPFAQETPTTYAKFDPIAGSLTLVVAELVSTASLKRDDCPASRVDADGTSHLVICMNPPPSWFKAKVVQHIAGADIGDAFYAVTGSHYGPMKIGAAEPARLMLLNSNGTALEMMRYKSYPVNRRRDGQLYLVLQGGPVFWLPCRTASLKEEIDDRDFDDSLTITREEYDSRWAQHYADYYRVTADSARPRYAIPVDRLQQALKDVPLAAADFSCPPPRLNQQR